MPSPMILCHPSSLLTLPFSGLNRRQLHQGAHEKRPVHCHFAPKQHVRAGCPSCWCLQGEPHDEERDDREPGLHRADARAGPRSRPDTASHATDDDGAMRRREEERRRVLRMMGSLLFCARFELIMPVNIVAPLGGPGLVLCVSSV